MHSTASVSSLLISILMVLGAVGVGRTVSRFCRLPGRGVGESLLDAALGSGVLSLFVYLLLAVHVPGRIGIAGFAALMTFLLLPFVAGALIVIKREVLPALKSACWNMRWRRLLGSALLAALALAAVIPALAPPSMSDWDSLAYHLSVPRMYLEHGGFYYIDFMSHSNFPMLMEMLYAYPLSLGDPVAAKLIHYWVGVMLVAAVALAVRRNFNPNGAWLAAIACAGMPIVLWEATTAYIDLAAALYTIVCVHLILAYLRNHDRRSLIGCALSAGFAASTKMTALLLIPLILLWLVIDGIVVRREFAWKRGLLFAALAFLTASPWYIKSLIYTGSPVYPFFYSIFGGANWSAQLADNYAALQAKFGVGHDFGSFFLLPYDITFNPAAFYDTPGLYTGPILLLAVPILLVGRWGGRKLVGLAALFISMVVVWFLLTQQSRYLIPAFAVLAVILAAVVYDGERFRITRIALTLAFVITAVFGIWTLSPAISSCWRVFVGAETRNDYLYRTLDIYPAQQYVNDSLPEDAVIALFGDTRGFYLQRDYVWADPGHNTMFTRDFSSVSQFTAYLRSKGITHALVNYRFFPSREGAGGTARLVYQAVDEGYFLVVYPVADYSTSAVVYEIINP